MSVRFDGTSNDELTTTAGLPSIHSFSMCGWVYISVDRNSYSTFFSLNSSTSDAAGNLLCCQTGTDGLSFSVYSNLSMTSPTGVDIGLNSWAFVGVTCSGTGAGALKLHVRTLSASAPTVNTGTAPVAITLAEIGLGETPWNEPLNGRVAYVKAWDHALTDDEMAAQSFIARPIKHTGLSHWWPMIGSTTADSYKDWSGNGRDLTETGTLAVEDGPPIPWGAPIMIPGIVNPLVATAFQPNSF